MTCLFKSREKIIRERIAELDEQFLEVAFLSSWEARQECFAIKRAISRMYKLINKR